MVIGAVTGILILSLVEAVGMGRSWWRVVDVYLTDRRTRRLPPPRRLHLVRRD